MATLMRVEEESAGFELDRTCIKPVHFKDYVVEVFTGVAFRVNREPLQVIAKGLYSPIFFRDPEETSKIVDKNLLHENAGMALVRLAELPNGPYDGFMSGTRYSLTVGEGESESKLNVGYLSDRALSERIRQDGVGTLLYELFPFMFSSDKEPLDMTFHRAGNMAAFYTAIRSGVFQNGYFPFGDGKKPALYAANPLVEAAAYALHPIIRRYAYAYHSETGLSKGEYKQMGGDFRPVYEPHSEHEPTMRILKIFEHLGGRYKNGDAFIAGGPARPMALILAANPQLLKDPAFAYLKEAA